MPHAQKEFTDLIKNLMESEDLQKTGPVLVAIANLVEAFGYEGTPEAIVELLQSRGLEASSGMLWSYVSLLVPNVGIESTGTGAPLSDFSIVELRYTNPATNQELTTYAAVVNANEGTIIDSFDGIVKSWDVYGGPVGFVSFREYPLVNATPIQAVEVQASEPTPVDLASDLPEEEKFDLENDEPAGGFLDDLEVTPRAPTRSELKWQATYEPGLNVIQAYAIEDTVINDLTGQQPTVLLEKDTICNIIGKFKKDGKLYFRTKTSADRNMWYGIPRESLRKITDPEAAEREVDELLYNLSHEDGDEEDETLHDKVVKRTATIEGKVKKIFKRN